MAAPRQGRQRHAVDVARRRGCRRIEVRVGVDPDKTRPDSRRGTRNPGDSPDGDGVIPAEEDREHPLGYYGRGPLGDLLTDALYRGEVLYLLPRRDGFG